MPPAATKASRRILLVEDNEDVREAMQELLTMDGHQVQTATEGAEALRQAPAFNPQVALVDIGLPGMNGYELARELRRVFGDRLLMVALTGFDEPADRALAIEAGFDAHLVKPIDHQALAALLSGSPPSQPG